ncbi:alpha/beta hydrolase family protein [Paenibacillus ginsengarvi]|uniref:alpha/beta hydrolase family protein n=1 Tax=Paenibacillus ginsengarvi TaxID=400777 RepID=UPI001EFF8455|nr:prolyl oligopeptidase family serine peptidase [Paenibacillus ginsengarvi]
MGYTLEQLKRDGIPKLLNGIADRDGWEAKRKEIKARWEAFIGGLPELVPLRYDVLAEEEEERHRRVHLRYDTAYGDSVTAFLLIPKDGLRNADGKMPAIMALHQTANEGKAEICLPTGKKNRRYGYELANRGYVVLAPDTITAGERVYEGASPFQTAPFYEKYPEWSAVAKMIADHRQGIDLLVSLEEVDAANIGAIGHSLGGYNAFFLAGADERIRAVVSSCGFATFTGDEKPNRWGRRDWFSHIPAVTDELEQGRVPFEWHEIAALAAPTPFFNWSGQADAIFPHWEPIAEAMRDLRGLYEWLGEPERMLSLDGTSGHDFPTPVRAAAYEFFDMWLHASSVTGQTGE